MTDWLAVCRLCVADIREVLLRLPTRVEREPVLRRGQGGDDTTAIDQAAEDAVVDAPLRVGRRLRARLRGARRENLRRGRHAAGRRRPDRRLRQREARHPVLLLLSGGRGRADDGRRLLRLRLRLRHRGGVDGGAREGRVPPGRAPRIGGPRRTGSRSSRSRARRPRPSPSGSRAFSGSSTVCE